MLAMTTKNTYITIAPSTTNQSGVAILPRILMQRLA
jgi:hypothetical protein